MLQFFLDLQFIQTHTKCERVLEYSLLREHFIGTDVCFDMSQKLDL